MSIFDYFRANKKTSASLAKERLQIIVAHQRGESADFLPLLQQELIEVISKYVDIDQDQVKVELERSGDTSVLELNVILSNKSSDKTSKSDLDESSEAETNEKDVLLQ